jgi:hypothetical protein
MLAAFLAAIFLSPTPLQSIPPAILHDSIRVNDISSSSITIPSSCVVLFTFPRPYGVLLLDDAPVDFYVYTSHWYGPNVSRAGFISMGSQRGFVEVMARANVTITYVATYLTMSGYPCTQISARSAGIVSIDEVMENESLCLVSAWSQGRVHFESSLGDCAVLNVTGRLFNSIPDPPLELPVPAARHVIVSAASDCSNLSLSIQYISTQIRRDFGTLGFQEDLRFGLFDGSNWAEFTEMADDPNVPTAAPPTAEFHWQSASFTSFIVTSTVVFMMIIVLGVTIRTFVRVVRPRRRAARCGNRDFAPQPMPDELSEFEPESPDSEASDAPTPSDVQVPDSPYAMGETFHGWT